jgi:hypothetical protein
MIHRSSTLTITAVCPNTSATMYTLSGISRAPLGETIFTKKISDPQVIFSMMQMKENSNWNHDIQRAMSHSVNRRIIECLHHEDLSFTELLNKIDHDANHGKFGYHLRTLREFIELEPTTKKYHLTDRGKLLAGAIRDFSFLTSRGKEASRYAEHLKIGDHAVALYSDNTFKRKIAFPFLKAGLSSGKAAVYFVSEENMDSEVREIRKCGMDIDQWPTEAITIMSAYEWYPRKGKAKAKTITANWQTLIQEKKKAGFPGVQVATETADFIYNGRSEELLRYEELLGRQLAPDLCVCGLCLYDKNILEEEHFLRVFKCHGHMISKDIIGKTIA